MERDEFGAAVRQLRELTAPTAVGLPVGRRRVQGLRREELVPLIRDGGVLVNTTVWMPAPSDEKRGVRGIDLFVRSDADQLADLAARVSTGELRIQVAQRVALADLPALHAQAGAGELPGKTIILPPTA
ncbi:zinc-binding dehydrogenase [Micromonospora sp. CA-246542]|uniref:zinc-binding dehydrogenase n=1 Tax=Micromonospora sp. CA-246542 TaxID=3239959 RepID=UPI003D9289C1